MAARDVAERDPKRMRTGVGGVSEEGLVLARQVCAGCKSRTQRLTKIVAGRRVSRQRRPASPPLTNRRHPPERYRSRQMSRTQIWAPFLIGFVGGTLLALVSVPIAGYFGVSVFSLSGVTLYGGMPVLLVFGPEVSFLAATASRTWRGLLTLVLGFAAAGMALGLLLVMGGVRLDIAEVAFYMTLGLGFLGVPTYLIVVGAIQVIDRLREPRPPEGR
jgi:hypothetical protein